MPDARILLAWAWFFLVLFAYYALKPLRDSLATETASLARLYLAVFAATCVALPLYWQIAARVTRRQLVAGVYQFFVVCLLVLAWLLHRGYADQAWLRNFFFVWVSVFNLYVVAVFWSVMADLFAADEGKRWFGSMAAAGTLGSISASALAAAAAPRWGAPWLLALAVAALEAAVLAADWLLRREGRVAQAASEPPVASGSLRAGLLAVARSRYLLLICTFVAVGKFAATFFYNNLQAALRAEELARAERLQLFSTMNLYAQSGTLLLQSAGAALLLSWCGTAATLALAGGAIAALFAWLAVDPSLWPLVAGQVVQQIVAYGLLVPAQQVLFTVASRDEKYQSKAFVDTVVFRGSDVAASQACDALLHLPLSRVALAFLPLMAAWAALGGLLGREQQRRKELAELPPPPVADGRSWTLAEEGGS